MPLLIDFLGDVRRLVLNAFASGRRSIKMTALHNAIVDKSHAAAEAAVSPGVAAMEKALLKKFPAVLTNIQKASGDAAAKSLIYLLQTKGLRASAAPSVVKLDYKFDATNPKAVTWVKEHALTLVKNITETTREDLRGTILSAFEDQRAIVDIVKDIVDVIDDPVRAEVIARTETMEAANEGQSELWDQAVDDGLLTGQEKQVWIVTPDDRLCPICEPMDGVTAGLDEEFESDEGDKFDGPPAHPNCRCTIGLVL